MYDGLVLGSDVSTLDGHDRRGRRPVRIHHPVLVLDRRDGTLPVVLDVILLCQEYMVEALRGTKADGICPRCRRKLSSSTSVKPSSCACWAAVVLAGRPNVLDAEQLGHRVVVEGIPHDLVRVAIPPLLR